MSPRAQTEKAVSASLGAELADSQSQKSRASLGGTPSPCMRSFHGQESSVSTLPRLHQGLPLLIRMVTPQETRDEMRATEVIPDVHVPHEFCAEMQALCYPKSLRNRGDS